MKRMLTAILTHGTQDMLVSHCCAWGTSASLGWTVIGPAAFLAGFQREGQATIAQSSEVRLLLHLCKGCVNSAKRVPLFCSSCNIT